MTVEMGSSEFNVDMEDFSAAITTVTGCVNTISSDFTQIKSQLDQVEQVWISPASGTYPPFRQSLVSATQHLVDLLNEMVSRMNTTYTNYQQAEQANAQNLT